MEGMGAGYVSFEVCNISGGTLTDLNVQLDSITASGFELGQGQQQVQRIASLDADSCTTIYWFMDWPCIEDSTTAFRVTVSDNSSDTVSVSSSITTTEAISANATGIVATYLLGPGLTIGQIITYDVVYEYGTVESGEELSFQPAGNEDFNAACTQLVGTVILSSDVNSIEAGTRDRIFLTTSAKTTGSGNEVAVRYYFKSQCVGVSTYTRPYAFANSGTQLKYTGNYDGLAVDTFPEASNAFEISKSGSQINLGPGDSIIYSVVIRNTSAFHTSLDSIVDILPASFSFSKLSSLSDIQNSNSTHIPMSGSTGTLTFNGGVPADSFPYSEYFIASGDSILLIYSVDIPLSTPSGSYENSVVIHSGLYSSTPVSFTVNVGSNDPPIAMDDYDTIVDGMALIINVLENDNDPDGSLIGDSIFLITNPLNGIVSAVGDSTMTYAPNFIFTGIDSFQYEICDTSAFGSLCDTAWAYIAISAADTIVDLALKKTLSDIGRPVLSGDTLQFNFHLFNQGNVKVQNVEIVDYIGAGYSFSSENIPEWTLQEPFIATTTYQDTILPGDSVLLSILLIVNEGAQLDDLVNYGEISYIEDGEGNEAVDIDSNPDRDNNNDGNVSDDIIDGSNNDEDDHDITVPEVFDLALRKHPFGSSNVAVGDTVTFCIGK